MSILFEFDAELSERRRGETEWTDKPIEEGANIADFGHNKPENFDVEGVVTAWPLFPTPGHDPTRVIRIEEALQTLRKKKQPVTLITGWWTPTIVIKSVDSSSGTEEGESVRIQVNCQTIELPQPVYTTIPASRLQPSVRKRATPSPTKGGAAQGKPKAPPSKSKSTRSVFCGIVGTWCSS